MRFWMSLALTSTVVFAYAGPGPWKNLFDGKTTTGWHSYGKTGVKGWMVMGGSLMTHGKSGDLVTDEEFENFELEFEFKIKPKGNSGVMYKVIEDPAHPPYYSGPEYQLIDDEGYPPFNDNGKMVKINDKQKTGANYDMQAPSKFVAKPAGEWNKAKILVKGNHIEHWLNGEKVLAYEPGSPAILAQVAKTKFKDVPGFGTKIRGHILLTYHNDECSFRSVKVRELKPAK